jgi:hypothetical protein
VTQLPDSIGRRIVRGASLALAAALGGWFIALLLTGGFETSLFGLRLTSHDPYKLLLAASLMFSVYVLSGGAVWLPGPRLRQSALRVLTLPARIDQRVTVGALATAVVIIGLRYGTYTAGGSDSYGYVSEAPLWLAGQPVVPQPWATQVPWPDAISSFAPLGYRPKGPDAIVPTYPAGLPLLMAAAEAIAGPCAVYWVTPVLGGVMVVFTWLLGGRLGSRRAGLIASWLIATSPPLLVMLTSPITDVPVAAVWTVAWYFVLGPGLGSAFGAGLTAGLASLIRPNLAPLCGCFVLWKLYQWYRAPAGQRKHAFLMLVALGIGFLPGAIALASINAHLYGSPLMTGYGAASGYFSVSNILPNIGNYWRWLLEAQTPVVVLGLVALVLPLKRLWTNVPDRGAVVFAALFVAALWGQYFAFLVFDAWWYIRFLLSCWPLIMIGLARVFELGLRPGRTALSLAVVSVVILLGWRGLSTARDAGAFGAWRGEHKYVTAGLLAREHTPENSVLLSMQHSGSVRHYGGRMTLRYDALQPSRLDQDMAWLNAHGAHPYALIEDWEADIFRTNFAGTATAALLDRPPLVLYHGPSRVLLYDLLPGPPVRTLVLTEDPYPGRCVPPAPLPQLVLK